MKFYKFIIKKFKYKIKEFLKKKVNFPIHNYQNLYTNIKIQDFHSGNFNLFHNKFSLKDHHLKENTNKTRYRNYINFKFAEQAIRDNKNGSFLSVGISYGTTVKVISYLLDNKINQMKYFLIDSFVNVGDLNYNTDIKNVKDDLLDIKNFEFIYIKELLNQSSIKKVDNDLIFTHLNTSNFEVEFQFLPEILQKTKSNGIIIIDSYGWANTSQQKRFDEFVLKNSNLFKFVFPSLQCVLIKK